MRAADGVYGPRELSVMCNVDVLLQHRCVHDLGQPLGLDAGEGAVGAEAGDAEAEDVADQGPAEVEGGAEAAVGIGADRGVAGKVQTAIAPQVL